MNRVPIRVRLTLVFAAVLALVLVVAGTFTYTGVQHERDVAIDTRLHTRVAAVVGAVRGGEPKRVLAALLGSGDEQYGVVRDTDGAVRVASDNLAGVALPRVPAGTTRTARVDVLAETRRLRVAAATAGDGTTVTVAVALDDRDDALRQLVALVVGGSAVTFAIAVLLAWAVAGAALRPVERMRRDVDAFTADDLEARLDVPPADDGLRRLALTLNRMLLRIDDTVTRQRSFVDHASHELRTPLANLTTEIDVALRRPRPNEELRDALRSAGEEVQRLTRLASALLAFARQDVGRAPLVARPVDVVAVVAATVRTFDARAVERHVELAVDGPATVDAVVDADRVRDAVSNLVDNALRFVPDGGSVRVAITSDERVVAISVTDNGPGFAPGIVAHAFEPFVCGDDGGGAGLGLAIVDRVARAHGGTVAIEPSPIGARITLSLPRHAAAV